MPRFVAFTSLLGLMGLCAASAGCDGPMQPTDNPWVNSALSPNAGSMLATTEVVFTGHGFRPGVTVLFGDSPALVKEVTDTKLTVEAPPHAAGTVNVVVTNPGGSKHLLANSYTYELDPPFAIYGVITEFTVNGDRPVEGVDVMEYGNKTSVLTDANGAYRLSIRRSTVELWISKAGYLGESRDITSTSDLRIDVQLSRIQK
jgi:hypothetical protein